jgi:hypothetical protein
MVPERMNAHVQEHASTSRTAAKKIDREEGRPTERVADEFEADLKKCSKRQGAA